MAVGGDPTVVAVGLATIFAAGSAKGIVGLRFPTLPVAVLATPIGSTAAIAVVPHVVTDNAQARTGGRRLPETRFRRLRVVASSPSAPIRRWPAADQAPAMPSKKRVRLRPSVGEG